MATLSPVLPLAKHSSRNLSIEHVLNTSVSNEQLLERLNQKGLNMNKLSFDGSSEFASFECSMAEQLQGNINF
jgi:hypothetical protein